MSKYFIRMAAIMVMAGLVLAGCGDGAGNGNTDPQTLVITGLPAGWTDVSAALWNGGGEYDGVSAAGEAAVEDGGAVIPLKNFDYETFALSGDWTGTGDYYVLLWRGPWDIVMGGRSPDFNTVGKFSFTGSPVSIPYASFDGKDPGREIGKIRGTVPLTDIPSDVLQVSLSASFGDKTSYQWGEGAMLDLSGISGSGTASWTIPLYENDISNGTWDDITGSQPLRFVLRVDLKGGNEYEIDLGSKTVDMSNKGNIPAVNFPSASLAFFKLSGTVIFDNGGKSLSRISISALDTATHNQGIGNTYLEPAVSGDSWEIVISTQRAAKQIGFYVSAYEGEFKDNGDNRVFSGNFEPDETKTVSNTNISGIVLDLGKIGGSKDDNDNNNDNNNNNNDDDDDKGALPGAKGKLTLTGFSEFDGKYVYSALVTTSGKYLIGMNAVTLSGSEAVISMVPISGGNAEVRPSIPRIPAVQPWRTCTCPTMAAKHSRQWRL